MKKIVLTLTILCLLFSSLIVFAEEMEQDQKEEYLKENITKVANENGLQGDDFNIVKFGWDDNNTCVVEVQNEENLIKAKVTFTEDNKIDSFKINYDNENVGVEIQNDSFEIDDKNGQVVEYVKELFEELKEYILNFFKNVKEN